MLLRKSFGLKSLLHLNLFVESEILVFKSQIYNSQHNYTNCYFSFNYFDRQSTSDCFALKFIFQNNTFGSLAQATCFAL